MFIYSTCTICVDFVPEVSSFDNVPIDRAVSSPLIKLLFVVGDKGVCLIFAVKA